MRCLRLIAFINPPSSSSFYPAHSTLICLKSHQAASHQLQEARDASAAHAAQPEEITKAEEERAALLAKFPLLGRRQGEKRKPKEVRH